MSAPEHPAIRAWWEARQPHGTTVERARRAFDAGDDLCRALEAAEAALRECEEGLRTIRDVLERR